MIHEKYFSTYLYVNLLACRNICELYKHNEFLKIALVLLWNLSIPEVVIKQGNPGYRRFGVPRPSSVGGRKFPFWFIIIFEGRIISHDKIKTKNNYLCRIYDSTFCDTWHYSNYYNSIIISDIVLFSTICHINKNYE